MAWQLSGCSSQRLVLTIMPRRGDETSLETRQPSLFRHLRKTKYVTPHFIPQQKVEKLPLA